MGARNVRVFGSQLRGDEHLDSDIDLLVEFEVPNLLDRIAMKNELEDELGLPVDLLTDESLHPLLRNEILGEAQEL
ncbi:nucleotidyltransferase family protein [Alicyclobacillus mengziensis]|uniref:Nucleotidyltransferase family protein n=1 Tax=Alicyclobacillus mengziensis TaxID=2931921 RepID=A0A9X7VZN9_9BACL|nr:nucleotidyltransferase family protein [Alicyclobacillus mengziensis]QSO47487.1 nucleotidyltransferase family protein [Alicyclobacillus mengziensis]